MEELQTFFDHHYTRLVAYLARIAPRFRPQPDFQEYLDEVLDDWAKVGIEARRAPYLPGERVFWFTLYTLEELAELPPDAFRDPFVIDMCKTVKRMRRRLLDRKPLPPGFAVCRPGGIEMMLEDLNPFGDESDVDEYEQAAFENEISFGRSPKPIH